MYYHEMLLLYPSLLLSVYSVFEGLEWNTWRANGRNIRCFSDTWGMRVSSFQFTHLVKHFINNTLQSHLLCLNIMLWQAVSNRLSFGKVTQEWRDALICARFTSWGLRRRKSSSYSGYSPCSLANFPVPEASFGVVLSSNHFSSSRIW